MKLIIVLLALVLAVIGGAVPMFFGDKDLLSGWAIIGGFAGGVFGVWLGTAIAKRWGE